MLKAVYILDREDLPRLYPADVQAQIGELVDVIAPILSRDEALQRPDLLSQSDVLLSGWGGPKLTCEFLECAPKLKAVFYGAGSIGYMVTDAFWDRNIPITCANHLNAIPVAQFTLAHILLGLKSAWRQVSETRRRRAFYPRLPVVGAYGSTVGIISLSTIGRLVCQYLKPFGLRVLAYDPTVSLAEAAELGIELVPLRQLFAAADVVSLHAPQIPETMGMITGPLFATMREGATFINTARGPIVRETEMLEVLKQRPDLTAVLDVTDPEPPPATSEIYDLPNVILTPHIAGSLDGECRRMGEFIVQEIKRYLKGEELAGQVMPPKGRAMRDLKKAREEAAETSAYTPAAAPDFDSSALPAFSARSAT